MRRVLVLAAAADILAFAANVALGSLVALAAAVAVIVCLAMVVAQTRLIGTLRQRERELGGPARPRMTPEDWRRLRELEIELGWEPSEPPADIEAPVVASPVRDDSECRCLECRKRLLLSRIKARNSAIGDRIAEVERKIDQIESGSTAPETAPAPMTGPGGRWHPVSELAERDAETAEHFAALARIGMVSCISYCPMCAGRDAGAETVETMRKWLDGPIGDEDGRAMTRRAMAGNPALLAEMERGWARRDAREAGAVRRRRREAARIITMDAGRPYYTVPWAMRADEDGGLWLAPDYTVWGRPGGTASMRIELREDGYHVWPVRREEYPPAGDAPEKSLVPVAVLEGER
jgi:hypothetical protein